MDAEIKNWVKSRLKEFMAEYADFNVEDTHMMTAFLELKMGILEKLSRAEYDEYNEPYPREILIDAMEELRVEVHEDVKWAEKNSFIDLKKGKKAA